MDPQHRLLTLAWLAVVLVLSLVVEVGGRVLRKKSGLDTRDLARYKRVEKIWLSGIILCLLLSSFGMLIEAS